MPQHEQYEGEERRSHCSQHEVNSSDLSSIKGTLSVAKWLLGASVVVLLAMVQMALTKLDQIQASLNNGRESIVKIERDVAHLDSRVTDIEKRHERLDQYGVVKQLPRR